MGVPFLFYNYYKKFSKENELMIDFPTLTNMDINAIFFDANSLVHPCAQQILSANHKHYMKIESDIERIEIMERDIISNCITYTLNVINQTKVKNIYIIIDGVAPRAKMNQQRERRYKSTFFKIVDDDDNEKSSLWDSNKITPGTDFMRKLNESLVHFKNNYKDNLNIFISDSNDPGEGEHKIMKIVSQKLIINKDQKILIYGLDADLLFLSILNKMSDSIILIRDNTFNTKLTSDQRSLDYVNICNLKHYIYTDFINTLKIKHTVQFDKQKLLHDYIFCCFFLGNDFLEHLPSISIKTNGIDTIIKAYTNAWKGKYLFTESINLIFLKDIMYQLKNHESYFFKKFRLETLATSELETFEKLKLKDTLSFYTDDILKLNQSGYKERYYLYYGIKQSEIKNACLNYLQGLSWIQGYYKGHIHNNWSWYYTYHNTPYCSDLFEFLRTTNECDIKQKLNIMEDQPVSYIKQLCLVLPKQSLITILKEQTHTPNNIYNFIETFSTYYPDFLFIDIINKRYIWQSKLFFQDINEKTIDLFLN